MQRTLTDRHLVGLLFTLVLPATGNAQIHVYEPGDVIDHLTYVEIPGEREFSSGVIARPVQRDAWTAAGYDDEQTDAWMTVAHVMLSGFPVN